MELPRDDNQAIVPLTPARTALARTVDTDISTSTQITFNASTTLLEVTARSEGAYLKWGTTAVTSSNFDEYIHSDMTRHYQVPRDLTTGALYTACTLIQYATGTAIIVIEK